MKINLHIDTETKKIGFEVGKTDCFEADDNSICGSAPYDYFAKLRLENIINELVEDYNGEEEQIGWGNHPTPSSVSATGQQAPKILSHPGHKSQEEKCGQTAQNL